jgi:quinoprotein glucose dehydrogenase
MNSGEHLWWMPVGDTPDAVLNHPDLQDMDIPNTGYGLRVAQMTVTPNLLIHTGNASDGTPTLYAVDKQTGERLASIEVPGESSYGMMTYVHDGKQYIMLQTRSTLTAMALGEF